MAIQAALNQKQTDRVGLVKLLKSKIGNKDMLTVNSYTVSQIINLLINDETRNIRPKEFFQCKVHKIYLKFSDEQAALKAIRSSCFGRQILGSFQKNLNLIKFNLIKKEATPLIIKHIIFPLIFTCTSTLYKVQDSSLK